MVRDAEVNAEEDRKFEELASAVTKAMPWFTRRAKMVADAGDKSER